MLVLTWDKFEVEVWEAARNYAEEAGISTKDGLNKYQESSNRYSHKAASSSVGIAGYCLFAAVCLKKQQKKKKTGESMIAEIRKITLTSSKQLRPKKCVEL